MCLKSFFEQHNNLFVMLSMSTMSKDFRFNKKEYGFDDFATEMVDDQKHAKTRKFVAPPKPKNSFKRFDKRA